MVEGVEPGVPADSRRYPLRCLAEVVSYTTGVGVSWAASADKHGVDREDAVHAIANAVYVEVAFDEPRPPRSVGATLYIGPPRQRGGALLEVLVEVRPPRGLRVFHVMPARPKILARMEEEQ